MASRDSNVMFANATLTEADLPPEHPIHTTFTHEVPCLSLLKRGQQMSHNVPLGPL